MFDTLIVSLKQRVTSRTFVRVVVPLLLGTALLFGSVSIVAPNADAPGVSAATERITDLEWADAGDSARRGARDVTTGGDDGLVVHSTTGGDVGPAHRSVPERRLNGTENAASLAPGRDPDTTNNPDMMNGTTGPTTEPHAAPTARNDSVAVYPGTVAVISLLANDPAPDGTPERSRLRIQDRPDNGTLSVLGKSGLVRYRHGRLAGYRDSFTYAVVDGDSTVSNINTVSINITKDAPRGARSDVVGGGSSSDATIGDFSGAGTASTDSSMGGGLTALASTSDFSRQRILEGYNQPISFGFLPDGRMILLQKNGEMYIANATESPVVAEKYMTVPDVRTYGEQGLLDIALDPNFTENGYIYLYYTNDTVDKNRISRFEHVENGGGLDSYGRPESERIVWQNEQTDASVCCHFGGELAVGPQGMLWLTTGDQFNGSAAQDLSVANGKMIRINRNGTVPSSNPFTDDPDALDTIYAYGLRNPYRASFDLSTDRFFVGEVGGNNDTIAQEDINLAVEGANYGWPDCEGFCDNPEYTDPIYTYPHNGSGASVTVGPLYRGNQFPSSYQEKLFYGDYVRGWIKYLGFNSSGGVTGSSELYSTSDAIVQIDQGTDGSIYYAGIVDGNIYRIRYDGNQLPEISEANANVTTGPEPLTVEFTGNATDADGQDLTYTWVFGDGNESRGKTAVHTYRSNGSYDAHLEVSDGIETVSSKPITIQVGFPPGVTITAPANESLFRAGDDISFEANGSDPDGELSKSAYSWDLHFLHDEHTHPGFNDVNGSTATYTVPTDGHDYSGDTGYRATVTVTDSDGLTDTDRVSVYPDKVNLTFRSDPGGLEFELDSARLKTPYRHDTLIGFTHTIEAPADQCHDGTAYAFTGWSDGGDRVHDITVPDTDAEYTARYEANGTCQQLVTDGLVLGLETDQGVSTSGDTVTTWADQSGYGNNLTAEGDPVLAPNGTPTGAPAVRFDGAGDALLRTDTLNGFPTGNQNRTVFLVTEYRSVGFGGFAYGRAACNNAFGTIVDDAGNLAVQGWCGPNDYPTDTPGTAAGWLTQSVVLEGSQLAQYRNGTRIDSAAHTFETGSDRLVLGAELTPAPYLEMDVAAALVYDRALSDAERGEVQGYLAQRYVTDGGSGETNAAPVVANDSAVVHPGNTVEIDVLANDYDTDGSLDASSVTVTREPTSGSVSVNATTGNVTYTHDGSGSGSDSFAYTVADDDGAVSEEATVSIDVNETGDVNETDIPTDGLVLGLETDQGVSTSGDTVTAWADQSGYGNNLTAEGDPVLAPNGTPTGAPAVRFDGSGDALVRTDTLAGFPTGNQNRTVFLVTEYRSVGFGGFAYGRGRCNNAFGTIVDDGGNLTVQGWCGHNDYPTDTPGTAAGWLTQSAVLEGGQLTHYRNGTRIDTATHTFETGSDRLVLGAELTPAPYLEMDVAAALVYDRALSDAERGEVQQYLAQRYVNSSS